MIQWHKIADGIYPDEMELVWCYDKRGRYYTEIYHPFYKQRWDYQIIAWCRLPKYNA